MNRCPLLIGLLAAIVPVLVACDRDERATTATPATATGVSGSASVQRVRMPRNHIALTVDGQTHRADIASSLAHTFLGDSPGPRFHLDLSSAWLDGQAMGRVQLTIRNVDENTRTFALGGAGADAATLILADVPGLDGKRWRSIAGTMELEFHNPDPWTQPVTRATGRFDARFRELQPDRDDILEGGQELAVSGDFDYSGEPL